jgi:hypothetical protein
MITDLGIGTDSICMLCYRDAMAPAIVDEFVSAHCMPANPVMRSICITTVLVTQHCYYSVELCAIHLSIVEAAVITRSLVHHLSFIHFCAPSSMYLLTFLDDYDPSIC